jgi:hypothetical protein
MFDLVLAAALQTPPAREVPPPDDIVVTGLRDIDDPESAVTRRTLGSGRNGVAARRSRSVFQLAQRFADCAIRVDRAANRDRLRKALDGVVNGASQRFWQMRFVQQTSTCAQDVGIAQRDGISTIAPGLDTSYYERGAMFVRALRLFAPDLRLTKAQTADAAVQARFNAREVPLARFRLPVDRRYFETAVCVVRLQPELASRLIAVDDADSVARIEATMINGAKPCVGNARKVYFDPSQFRFYIADALYRWAVAAQGVTSLVPAGD